MAERKYYVFCDDNCKFETMSKEQILAAIDAAINKGIEAITDDGAFYEAVQETNHGRYIKFWIGTQAEYNALSNPDTNVLYIISDETSVDDIMNDIQQLQSAVQNTAEKFADVESGISDLETGYSALNSRVTAAENTVQQQGTAVNSLSQQVDTLDTNVDEYAETVDNTDELYQIVMQGGRRTSILSLEGRAVFEETSYEMSASYSDFQELILTYMQTHQTGIILRRRLLYIAPLSEQILLC